MSSQAANVDEAAAGGVADRPSGEELVRRARQLAPTLVERSAHAAEQRRIPVETIADFQRLGFFRMLQPARWGGL